MRKTEVVSLLNKFSPKNIVNGLLKNMPLILFVCSAGVIGYFSFVDTFNINPNRNDITIITAALAVINWVIWDTSYKNGYNKTLNEDIDNKAYSIHKRYYLAKLKWTQKTLQERVSQFNKEFRETCIEEVEAITMRTKEEIKAHPYKGYSHKLLIWRIKHEHFPKSGIKRARDISYLLSTGTASRMQIKLKAAEHFYAQKLSTKMIKTTVFAVCAASLAYTFITDGWHDAILKLLLCLFMLFSSLIFGTFSGIKGANIKLNIAEEISEKLEEWKGVIPTEVPYKDIDIDIEENVKEEIVEPKIEKHWYIEIL